MNYVKHYDELSERAKDRIIEGYTEKHRIVPGCLGGTYDADNVVRLTPEEHYVAHQLLVKIYPNEGRLVYAAKMMTVESKNNLRGNRLYGWLKRKYISECRKRVGEKNSSFGRAWYHNPIALSSGKFLETDVPKGWQKGRTPKNKCKICDTVISPESTYCLTHYNENRKTSPNLYVGREEEFYQYYDELGSMNKACKAMGFPGAMGYWYKHAKELLDTRKN